MKTRVLHENAVLGGEASGHVFFRELEGGDDGLYAALRMLDLLARADRPLSELVAELPRYFLTRDIRVPFEGDVAAVLELIAAQAEADGARIERLDGVKAHYEDGWALARASVTEPMITLRFEGATNTALLAAITRFLAPAPELLDAARQAAEAISTPPA